MLKDGIKSISKIAYFSMSFGVGFFFFFGFEEDEKYKRCQHTYCQYHKLSCVNADFPSGRKTMS